MGWKGKREPKRFVRKAIVQHLIVALLKHSIQKRCRGRAAGQDCSHRRSILGCLILADYICSPPTRTILAVRSASGRPGQGAVETKAIETECMLHNDSKTSTIRRSRFEYSQHVMQMQHRIYRTGDPPQIKPNITTKAKAKVYRSQISN